MDYNRVIGNTFHVIITYESILNTENIENQKLSIYPNPVQNVLNVTADENISEVRLYNMLGQEINHKSGMNSKEIKMDTSALAKGTYIVKVETEAGVKSLNVIKD